MDGRRQTDEVVEKSGVTWNSVRRVFNKDLETRREAAKFVPRLLTAKQKHGRLIAWSALQGGFQKLLKLFFQGHHR